MILLLLGIVGWFIASKWNNNNGATDLSTSATDSYDTIKEQSVAAVETLCTSQAQIGQSNTPTERAVVTPSYIGLDLPDSDDDDPSVYVNVFFTVTWSADSGIPYEGTPECPTATQLVVMAIWQQTENGTWILVATTPPEMPE